MNTNSNPIPNPTPPPIANPTPPPVAWIGLDWGHKAHAFVLQERAGPAQEGTLPHSAEALHAWRYSSLWLALAASLVGLIPGPVHAFPPAPHHKVYGLVRDEMGEPISFTTAQVILESATGVQVRGLVVPNLEPGVNYRLSVPMDAGTVSDLYTPTAMRPTMPFRMKVKIGLVTYLPMRLSGTNIMAGTSFSSLGKPAESTRIDLTLGDDADGDGISNLDEYLAGTYAFDPTDGFRLTLIPRADGAPLLEFMVIGPRAYTVHSSTDLQTWTPIEFKIPADGPAAPNLPNYPAVDVRILRVEPVLPPGLPAAQYFFKVQVQ